MISSGGAAARPRLSAALLACLTAVALGGCTAEGDEPPEPPTAAALAQFVADTRQPVYWLGPDYRGVAVSDISVTGGYTSLTYGKWACDAGSGCSDAGGVSTGPRAATLLADIEPVADAAPTDCWARIGKAVAVLDGCMPDGYPQLLLIYSGALQVSVTSIYTRNGQSEVSARTALRRLRPLNTHTPWPLPPPDRLSCQEFGRVDQRLRRHMPQPLRPTCRS